MKKIKNTTFLLCLLGTLAFHKSNAQNLRLGIVAGANMDKTSGKDLAGKFKGNFTGGVFVGGGSNKIRVQADLLFSQGTITTGDNFKDAFGNYINENAGSVKSGTFKMNELSIPLTLGINLLPKMLWFEIGPQYTAVVSIKDKNSFLTETERVFKKGYVSGVAGLSLELPFSLNVGVRYIMGITDRNNTEVNDAWRTNHIQVRVGWSLFK